MFGQGFPFDADGVLVDDFGVVVEEVPAELLLLVDIELVGAVVVDALETAVPIPRPKPSVPPAIPKASRSLPKRFVMDACSYRDETKVGPSPPHVSTGVWEEPQSCLGLSSSYPAVNSVSGCVSMRRR